MNRREFSKVLRNSRKKRQWFWSLLDRNLNDIYIINGIDFMDEDDQLGRELHQGQLAKQLR